jgi:hypothetical protein
MTSLVLFKQLTDMLQVIGWRTMEELGIRPPSPSRAPFEREREQRRSPGLIEEFDRDGPMPIQCPL